jgi:hypothetical protein
MKKLLITLSVLLLIGCLPTTPNDAWLKIRVNYSDVSLISLNGNYAIYDSNKELYGATPNPYVSGTVCHIRFDGSTSGYLTFWIGLNKYRTADPIQVLAGQTAEITIDGNLVVVAQ